jgi:hypothetical protein
MKFEKNMALTKKVSLKSQRTDISLLNQDLETFIEGKLAADLRAEFSIEFRYDILPARYEVLVQPYFDPLAEVREARVMMVGPAFRCFGLSFVKEIMNIGYAINDERLHFNRPRSSWLQFHAHFLHDDGPTGASVERVWIYDCGVPEYPATQEMIRLARESPRVTMEKMRMTKIIEREKKKRMVKVMRTAKAMMIRMSRLTETTEKGLEKRRVPQTNQR